MMRNINILNLPSIKIILKCKKMMILEKNFYANLCQNIKKYLKITIDKSQ